jgi:hypothetical protein
MRLPFTAPSCVDLYPAQKKVGNPPPLPKLTALIYPHPIFWCRIYLNTLYIEILQRSMGKSQKKTGKGRLDKYYKLAKFVVPSVLERSRC